MCVATVETRKGHMHTQCSRMLYALVDLEFPNGTHRRTSISYCPSCGMAEGTSRTPVELIEEWRSKGIKVKIL